MRFWVVIASVLCVTLFVAWIAIPDSGSASGDASGNEVLAHVGDSEITDADYRPAYFSYIGDTGLPDSPRRRSDFLDRLIGVKLLVVDAKRRGLEQSQSYRAGAARATEKLKLDFYVQQMALDTIEVREAELRQMFLRMNTSIHARHLYAESVEDARLLRDRLDAGASFEELAQEVFDDPELANSGGDLGYFGFDEMDPVFEDAAYVLPVGQVSDPVRTSQGYSIIEVLDRQPKPLLTESEFAQRKDRVEQYVLYRRHADARKALVEHIVDKLDLAYEPEGVAILVGFIRGSITLGDEAAALEVLATPLVTFGDARDRRTWTVGDFREHAQHTSPEQREAVRSEAYLRQFIEGLIVRQHMLEQFDDQAMSRDRSFARIKENTLDKLLYERAYDEHARAIAVSEDSVRSYFDTHRAEFAPEQKILVDEILVESRAEARHAMRALEDNPFGDVAARFSVRPGADESGGRLGYVARKQLGVLGDTLFAVPAGTTVGPIAVADKFGVFRVVEKTDATEATFEDLRPQIEELIRQQGKRAHMRALVDSLRREIQVIAYPERAISLDLRT